ncbi:MAG: CvpA family protein [Eubacteriaceae bacterium]|nr:CvpA family protein [Eubacteriaceae bacterium]
MFSWVDLPIAGILVYNIYEGYRNGFAKSLVYLVRFIVCLIASYTLCGRVADFYLKYTFWPARMEKIIAEMFANSVGFTFMAKSVSQFIVNIAGFITVYIILWLVFLFVIAISDLITNLPILKTFNTAAGTLVGIVKGLLASVIVSSVFWVLGYFIPPLMTMCESSVLVKFFYLGSLLNLAR